MPCINSYCVAPAANLARVHEAARHLHGKEGLVVYYVDPAGHTFGLEKHKSVWLV